MDDEFVKEIKELLALGYEGGYWDFKKRTQPGQQEVNIGHW